MILRSEFIQDSVFEQIKSIKITPGSVTRVRQWSPCQDRLSCRDRRPRSPPSLLYVRIPPPRTH